MGIKFQSSMIMVFDIGRSREFYEGLLKQKVILDHGRALGFEGGFAIMQVDYAYRVIHSRDRRDQDKLGSIHSEFYFETRDLDFTFARMKDAGVEFVHIVIEQPWGQRAFRCLDPDGYMIEIGEPMEAVIRRLLKEGKSTEEIAKYTSMPADIVNKIAESNG
jgi:catechol 2,3-dioxygenase-like lactoylglutathione lyase family enzyme